MDPVCAIGWVQRPPRKNEADDHASQDWG
jgi:hypothetical protein